MLILGLFNFAATSASFFSFIFYSNGFNFFSDISLALLFIYKFLALSSASFFSFILSSNGFNFSFTILYLFFITRSLASSSAYFLSICFFSNKLIVRGSFFLAAIFSNYSASRVVAFVNF